MNNRPIKAQISIKIDHSLHQVFLRSDFEKLSGYDQVGRALRELTEEGRLIKIGYGLYAKARLNRLTGKPMLAADGGFIQVAQESLTRLRVKWRESNVTTAYQNGGAQIPGNAELIVSGRFNRKIGTDKFKLQTTKAS